MLFSTWQFYAVFLPLVLAAFSLIPSGWRGTRKWWLLLASFVFYGWWRIEYVPLLLASMVVNYGVAEGLIRLKKRAAQKRLLIFGVAVNLALLGFYKYAGFALRSMGLLTGWEPPQFHVELPLAISFFTFTQIGYLVDVYRDRSLHYRTLDYGLFVVFFPHLIAGPIVRHWEVIPQFADRALKASRTDLGVGITLFLMGLGKKTLLADSVARYADPVFAAAQNGVVVPWFDSWFGATAYALQLYFDFSGYSDMAIGLARMFSIKFPMNFDSPYRAASITEFWQRWHVTLTRFFREYVYFPLGGNRCGHSRQVFNIMATMLLSGLWHGAGWTFVLWGGFHGTLLVVNHWWRRFKTARGWVLNGRGWRVGFGAPTFALVLLGWALFRAPDFQTAGSMVGSMLGTHGLTLSHEVTNPERQPGRFLTAIGFRFVPGETGIVGYTEGIRTVVVLLLVCWFCPNSQQLLSRFEPVTETRLRPSRWTWKLGLPAGLLLGALLFLVVRSLFTAASSPFLYFNF